jgi:hypothetical protein
MYFTGYLYTDDEWIEHLRQQAWRDWHARQANALAWRDWHARQASARDPLERIPELTGQLAACIDAVSRDAPIGTVCRLVEATCDELRERVFDQIAKVD